MLQLEDYLKAKIANHPYLKTLSAAEINLALATCVKIFPDSITPQLDDGILQLKIKEKHTLSISVVDEVLPALIFAHKHFGDQLPRDLIQKLKNPTQVKDTFFELKCLGEFGQKHKVVYEPKIGRKVPDLKVVLPDDQEIYVECKSHGNQQANFSKLFYKITDAFSKTLDNSPFIAKAWERNLRTEVIPIQTVHGAEILKFSENLSKSDPSDFMEERLLTEGIRVVCLPKNQPHHVESTMQQGLIKVGPVATKLDAENMYLVFHSWKGLDLQRRRSQRSLLAEARKKLKELPLNSLGLICIEVYSARQFLPDIHKLLGQPQYKTVPFVWLNPFNEGQIVCRNEHLDLRNRLFAGMIPIDPKRDDMQTGN